MFIAVNIAMCLALCAWGGLIIMSPMVFAAENYSTEASFIYAMAGFLFFPVPLLLLMHYFSYELIYWDSLYAAKIIAVIGAIIFVFSGSLGHLIKLRFGLKKINN